MNTCNLDKTLATNATTQHIDLLLQHLHEAHATFQKSLLQRHKIPITT